MAKRTICSAYTIWTFVLMLPAILARAHPGGRDSNGSHRDASTGRYHFHEGLLAGQEIATKEESLATLNSASTQPTSTDSTSTTHTSSDSVDSIIIASWNIRNISDNSRFDVVLGDQMTKVGMSWRLKTGCSLPWHHQVRQRLQIILI